VIFRLRFFVYLDYSTVVLLDCRLYWTIDTWCIGKILYCIYSILHTFYLHLLLSICNFVLFLFCFPCCLHLLLSICNCFCVLLGISCYSLAIYTIYLIYILYIIHTYYISYIYSVYLQYTSFAYFIHTI
jgi:hypothetical protein